MLLPTFLGGIFASRKRRCTSQKKRAPELAPAPSLFTNLNLLTLSAEPACYTWPAAGTTKGLRYSRVSCAFAASLPGKVSDCGSKVNCGPIRN
jgi:hypothetical protein